MNKDNELSIHWSDELFESVFKLDMTERRGANGMLFQARDGFRCRLSELLEADLASERLIAVLRNFVGTLALKSNGTYDFEKDFFAHPNHIYSYSLGHESRLQWYVSFDAIPVHISSRSASLIRNIWGEVMPGWGASVGIRFDFVKREGISVDCVREYQEFSENIMCAPDHHYDQLFEALGGYAEGQLKPNLPINSDKILNNPPTILDSDLFFGKRIRADDLRKMKTLSEFVDECIRVFDLISEAGLKPAAHNPLLRNFSLWAGSVRIPRPFGH